MKRESTKWSRVIIETLDVEHSIEVLGHVFGITHAAPFIYVSPGNLEDYVAREAGNLLENSESFAKCQCFLYLYC